MPHHISCVHLFRSGETAPSSDAYTRCWIALIRQAEEARSIGALPSGQGVVIGKGRRTDAE